MKAVSRMVVALSLGVLGYAAASAATDEQAYLATCRKDPGIPVPISVVSPAVGPEFTGQKVDVQFVVNAAGSPENLIVQSSTDEKLSAAVVQAVKRWKFKPAERNGIPVATKVMLPVKVVDVLDGSIYAAN